MFNAQEVTNEYNFLNDFLKNSLLDDGALVSSYSDELYNTDFQTTSAAPTSTPSIAVSRSLNHPSSGHVTPNTGPVLTAEHNSYNIERGRQEEQFLTGLNQVDGYGGEFRQAEPGGHPMHPISFDIHTPTSPEIKRMSPNIEPSRAGSISFMEPLPISPAFGALPRLAVSKEPVKQRLDLFMKATISQDMTTSEASRLKNRLCAFGSRPLCLSKREARSKVSR
jgi:hypothetical protein